MVVLVTCKKEDDLIKNEGARVFTTLYIKFSDAQGQITLELVVVSGQNLNSSKLSCMSSLPARMRMIESKMKELECSQDFSHYKSIHGIFPDAQDRHTCTIIYSMYRVNALRTPSRLRADYPTLLQWRGRYDFSRLKTSRVLPHTLRSDPIWSKT